MGPNKRYIIIMGAQSIKCFIGIDRHDKSIGGNVDVMVLFVFLFH